MPEEIPALLTAEITATKIRATLSRSTSVPTGQLAGARTRNSGS